MRESFGSLIGRGVEYVVFHSSTQDYAAGQGLLQSGHARIGYACAPQVERFQFLESLERLQTRIGDAWASPDVQTHQLRQACKVHHALVCQSQTVFQPNGFQTSEIAQMGQLAVRYFGAREVQELQSIEIRQRRQVRHRVAIQVDQFKFSQIRHWANRLHFVMSQPQVFQFRHARQWANVHDAVPFQINPRRQATNAIPEDLQ